jgi:hypothetical protein
LIRDSEVKNDIKLLGQFILVEFLQCLDVHVMSIHSLGLITVLLVPQDTHRELGTGIFSSLTMLHKLCPSRGHSSSADLQLFPGTSGACAGAGAGLPTLLPAVCVGDFALYGSPGSGNQKRASVFI